MTKIALNAQNLLGFRLAGAKATVRAGGKPGHKHGAYVGAKGWHWPR